MQRIILLTLTLFLNFLPASSNDTLVPPIASDAASDSHQSVPILINPTNTALPKKTATKAADTSSINDSLSLILRRDSHLVEEQARRTIHFPSSPELRSDSIVQEQLFRSDLSSWYDLLPLKRSYIAPRIGVANSLNRILYLGNTSPVDKWYPGTRMIYHTLSNPSITQGSYFPNEISMIVPESSGGLRFIPFSTDLISPESAFFWENGVFRENILSLRFTRPISRNAVINIFSNYRYFNAQQFNHDANDIYTIFSSLTSDSSILSNEGYNPLVNEFYCGAETEWKGKYSVFSSKIKYGDIANEVALNNASGDNYPTNARLTQFPLTVHTLWSGSTTARYYFDIEGLLVKNNQRWLRANESSGFLRAERLKTATFDGTGGIRGGVMFSGNDSVDMTFTSNYYKAEVPDSIEIPAYTFRPNLRWSHHIKIGNISGTTVIQPGYELYLSDSSKSYGPTVYAQISSAVNNYQLRGYFEYDWQHGFPQYDSLSSSSIYHNNYMRTGISLSATWSRCVVSLGYQFYPDPDSVILSRSWYNGIAPYPQPSSTLFLTSEIGRMFNCALYSRIMVTDTRPFIKLQSALSYHILPELTHEAIDCILGIDYWSKRNGSVFAEDTSWNRTVVDVNLTTSVHIKSFRLFYKIDNLLNRKFSYVPGYYSPGITFRWGFNWFIQR